MVVDAGRKNSGKRPVAAVPDSSRFRDSLLPALPTFEPFTKLVSSTTLCEVLSGHFQAIVCSFAFGEESTMNKTISRRLGLAAVVVVTLLLAVANPSGVRLLHPSTASAAPDQLSGTPFGVSGGNAKDISALFCCSGTLGSLVTDGSGRFILSNNHVLARTDSASLNEDISQPGLVDNQCRVPPTVAKLTAFPSLTSNVDAAIAALTPNSPMDTEGNISIIGRISNAPKFPTGGMAVQKVGRTTGLTSGLVSSISTNVKVQYQPRCGMGKKFTISFTNQVVVTPVSGSFSAGGDSGSLIVTNDTKQPVALLFAGSSTTTIGNPICEVLSTVSSKFGAQISFVGDSVGENDCLKFQGSAEPQPPSQPHKKAHDAKEKYADRLMSRPGVLGVGVGNTEDDKNPAVILYMDNNAPGPPFVPAQLDGVPVRVIRTETFVSQ